MGLIIGMIIELMIDAGTIRDLQSDNRRLRLEITQLKRENKKAQIYAVEITDKTVEPQNIPDYKGNF